MSFNVSYLSRGLVELVKWTECYQGINVLFLERTLKGYNSNTRYRLSTFPKLCRDFFSDFLHCYSFFVEGAK